MVEVAVYDALRKMVNSEIEEWQPLLTLKSSKDAKTYANGKNKNFRMTEYCINWYMALNFNPWSIRTDKAKAYYWFHENGKYILQLWLKDTYKTISNAISNSNSFDDLFNSYLGWFNQKRMETRKKMENQLKETTNSKLAEMKIPHSHGGVANLLKCRERISVALQKYNMLFVSKLESISRMNSLKMLQLLWNAKIQMF